MPQFAYVARTAAGTPSQVPSGWPFGWIYPGDGDNTPYPTSPATGTTNNPIIPGIPWPDNWPVQIQANTVVVVEAPATITLSGHSASIEAYITVGGAEAAASVYNRHLLQVTVTEGGATRNLKKSGGATYTPAIFFQVGNYAGNRYGFQQTIDFDPADWADLDLIDIQVKLVTAVANPQGADQWQVVYP